MAGETADCSRASSLPSGACSPSSLLLQWHLTNRCNLRCSHCYQTSYGGDELRFDELVDVLRDYEALLDDCRSKSRHSVPGHITVTGGEPFVRSDILPFLALLSNGRAHYSFALLTNGSLIDLPMARQLRALRPRFVQVSIEGVEDTHDRVRGPGNFRQTVAALKLLVRFGVRTMISFTAQRGNFREFADVAQLGAKLGVARIWADRLIPDNTRTAGALAPETLTPDETREFFEIMGAARHAIHARWFNRTEVAMHRALQFLVADGAPYRCSAGDTLVTVMPDGEVYPCRRMPISVGNVRKMRLSKIYASAPLFARLRTALKQQNPGCDACQHAVTCGGGLRCLSYALTGDPFRRDPGCWK